ncbi:MAG: glycosyltransferase [Promethearchaeota archaeon]
MPTYNRILKLYRLLKSLDRLNPIPDEIIIVDDNSKDKTKKLLIKWEKIKRAYKKEIILKASNKGPADSRNLGISKSRNDLVAFTDDDVIVHKEWIKYITLNLIKSKANLAGIGGVVKSVNNDILSQYYTEHKILEAPKNLNYIPTVNCCFRKNPLIEIGGFNTNFSFAGGEDTDLSLRLRDKSFFFQKEKRAIVFHDFSKNFIDFCKMWIRYGKGTQLAIINSQGRL